MPKVRILAFLLLFLSTNSYALMEMGANYGYDRKVYGSNRENKQTATTFSGSWAIYFLTLTALEFSFSQTEQVTTEKNSLPIDGSTITITGIVTNVDSSMFGIGIKQALGPRKARIRPAVSIGYARQFVENETFINYRDSSDGSTGSTRDSVYKSRNDSVTASFSLQLFLTKSFALTASVRTIFPAFKFDEAADDIKYMAGISWFL